MKRYFTLLAALLMALMLSGSIMAQESSDAANAGTEAEGYEYEEVFAEWNPEAPALNTLIDYVEAVTDESSEDFIPPADRIAVFDMDGTVYGELFPTYLEYYTLAWRILKDPSIEPDAEMLKVGRTLRDCALDKSFPEDMPVQHAIQAARAYAGMTLNEFSDFITQILLRDVDGFEGMTYGEAFYQPIIEVIEYLQENDFKVYIVSGSDRFICRTLIEGALDIPYENIIGMDVAMKATNQGDTDGLDYVFSAEDDVVRTDKLLIKNLKMNKVCQIVQDIGRQPVLSFGNSSGDVSMHNYTIYNNPYRSAAFMLIADDEVRDYGNTEKVQPLKEQWEKNGYNVISMKDDFKTIYGENVVKTGTFHWMEELADDRGDGADAETAQPAEAADAEPVQTDAAADEAEDKDVQYVMYLGTNDKDTNEPVFDHEQAKEKAKEILIDSFGGYTIQEAEGGWKADDGSVAQEYTLVIYLSDTTLEDVHAAADKMLETFNQSSVLIQENPTKTEFYDGSAK